MTEPFETSTDHSELDMRQKVLEILLSHQGEYVSGTTICESIGVSRTAVWKHIKALENLGVSIESVTRLGHKLLSIPDLLLPAIMKANVGSNQGIGKYILWHEAIDSTNMEAARQVKNAAPHGTVITAMRQLGGKGRRGRVWFSPNGGLWFSVVLRLPIPIRHAADLTLLTSVAVRRAIVRATGQNVLIKWPNDLLLNGRKICGILAEIRADGELLQHAIVGVGINSNIPAADFPSELSDYATSLVAEGSPPISNVKLAADIFLEMETLFTQMVESGIGFASVLVEWKNASATLGKSVRIMTPQGLVTGFAEDIDASGILYVKGDDGRLAPVHSGDVLFE